MRWMRLAPAAVAALAVFAAACGGVEKEPNLAKAIERTQATGSTRIEMTGSGVEDGTRVDTRCDGAFDYERDRFRLACDSIDRASDLEWLDIGDTSYVKWETVTGSKKWVKFPSGDEASPWEEFSPERFLALVRFASQETERIGEEQVRGKSTERYGLTVICEQSEITVCAEDTETVVVDVWIDQKGLMRRIQIDQAGVTLNMEFFDFGVPLDIEPPPADQVEDVNDVLGLGGRCEPGEGAPIRVTQAIGVLRSHGFNVKGNEDGCFGDAVAILTNGDASDIFEREGFVSCHVYAKPTADAPRTYVRPDDGDGASTHELENLFCTLFADPPKLEKKVDRLAQALDELERAIRP